MDPEVSLNVDCDVLDAEDTSGVHADGYDVNDIIEKVYAFNLDVVRVAIELPRMTSVHRGAIFKMAKKLKLAYASDASADALKAVTLTKPDGYVPQVWASPFSASKTKKGYDKLPVGPSLVLDDFMWLGSGRDADNLDTLQSLGINHVLNVTCEWKEAPHFKKHGFVYERIDIKDFVTSSMEAHFAPAFAFMDRARQPGNRLLVHCVVGKSRSATIVLAYLMTRERMTLRQSFEHVRRTRDIIRPNDAFMRELLRMEHDLHGGTSMTLADLPAMKVAFAGTVKAIENVDSWVRERLADNVLEAMFKQARGNRKAFVQLCVARVKGAAAREGGVAKKRAAAAAATVAQAFFDKHE